jgi:hypothetical protein
VAKKKKLTKTERKEQRRAAMERVRGEHGGEPPPPLPPVYHDEVLDDMLPLFPEITDPFAPLPSAEPVLMALVGSSALVDEPEFEAIIVDPMLCMATFVEVTEEMGHDLDALLQAPQEKREDVHIEILTETVRRLLTDDLRQQIRDGLDQLRLRLKGAGEAQAAARAAVLLSFLDPDAGSELWSMVGLVQAIFHRSVFIGFRMAESSLETVEAVDSAEDPVAMVERLAESRVGKKAEALLKRVPGLSKFLAQEADVTWDEGLNMRFDQTRETA